MKPSGVGGENSKSKSASIFLKNLGGTVQK